ncbi:hypothetical protein [uncultured Pluralibacter sp.]|uniref:hypothetical protein n=1 Tax=uncultured Pluralibacter sp. TaxID=1490864 RepID=UPI00262CA812|nr:hypothetical protein [uncultured Pluralibacter sp.]
MMTPIRRFLRRVFRSLFSMYGPALLTVLFAVFFFQLFPEGPLWAVPLFLIFLLVIFHRYVKW